jgi:AbrB family looped-hinge helix DNA binding protein
MSVSVGKEGRIVLPKAVRQKHKMEEGTRLILRECGDQIIMIPVLRYVKPTEAIYASIKTTIPVDQPKEKTREHIRRRLLEEFK